MPGKPNVKEIADTGDLSQTKIDFLVELMAKVQQDDDDRLMWKNKTIIATNQRLGVKRYSEYPYPGAPDIPLPETDKIIKKQVPTLVMSSWAPKEMCLVNVKPGYPENPEWEKKAQKAQNAMNEMLRSRRVNWFEKLWRAADYAKTFGHCLFRTREEFCSRMVKKTIDLGDYDPQVVKQLKAGTKTELRQFIADRYMLNVEDEDDLKSIDDAIVQLKNGDDVIEICYEEVESYPQVDVPQPTKVIVPPSTTALKDALRITLEYFLPRHKLESQMENGIFREKDLDALGLTMADDDIVEEQKKRSAGVEDSTSQSELYKIRETLTWYREKDSDKWQRWVFTYLADSGNPEEALLQDIEFPYEFSEDEWNYDRFDNELKDERHYDSRGVPEEIRAYQEIMERAINNMLIRDEMVNTPMYEVLNTSELLDTHVRFVPGAKLPVKAIGAELQAVGNQSLPDMASMNIMQLIKGFVEEYQSSDDYLFRNSTNAGGGKTLGEVQLGMSRNAGPRTIEVIHWNEVLSRVYQKMFEIMAERMGDSMYVKGEEITKEDFNFPAEVKSNGDLEVADQQLATQKAQMRLQVLLNPGLQDIVDSEDRYNALQDWLEKDGVKDPDKFSTNPNEIAQSQLKKMQQQMQQMQQQLMQGQKMIEKQMQQGEQLKRQEQQTRVKVSANQDDQETEMIKNVISDGGNKEEKKSPSESISFKDLPPEGQTQMAAQAGINIDVATLASFQDKQQKFQAEQAKARMNGPARVKSGSGTPENK
jgi:hypothetical protein